MLEGLCEAGCGLVRVEGKKHPTVDSVEDRAEVIIGVEQTRSFAEENGGKTAPFLRGRGRVGLAALSTGNPTQGKLAGLAAGAAAWCRAALSLTAGWTTLSSMWQRYLVGIL